MHCHCAITTRKIVVPLGPGSRMLMRRLQLFQLFVDDYWAKLTFDEDVRCTRVKLDDEDWLRNYMMHHMVKRGRGWVRDRCLKLAVLEM